MCRDCGYDIASAESLINLRSPFAVTRVNHSLFGIDEVYVQTLVNPLNIRFKVITALESSCTTSAQVSYHANRLCDYLGCLNPSFGS